LSCIAIYPIQYSGQNTGLEFQLTVCRQLVEVVAARC
jgi:hypothetical protein